MGDPHVELAAVQWRASIRRALEELPALSDELFDRWSASGDPGTDRRYRAVVTAIVLAETEDTRIRMGDEAQERLERGAIEVRGDAEEDQICPECEFEAEGLEHLSEHRRDRGH